VKAVRGDHRPVRRISVVAGACVTNREWYCRARYYHPALQRFIGEDPIGFAGGCTNLYAYVANNPPSFVDPLGLEKRAAEEPCRLDMPLTSGWRLPDYLSLNVKW
jgi:uncharacterized protein RhaS with RHS repeats